MANYWNETPPSQEETGSTGTFSSMSTRYPESAWKGECQQTVLDFTVDNWLPMKIPVVDKENQNFTSTGIRGI